MKPQNLPALSWVIDETNLCRQIRTAPWDDHPTIYTTSLKVGTGWTKINWANLKGIQLTPDQLVKVCGFKNQGQAIRLALTEYLEVCYIVPLQEMRLQTIESGFTEPGPKYLHELQNLFSCMKGKPLPINEHELRLSYS